MTDEELLAQIPLFEGLSAQDIAALASKLSHRTFAKGSRVFAIGDAGSSMYLVRTGRLCIYLPAEPRRVVVKEVHEGEYFGELSLFDAKPRSASVEALEATVLLELTREELFAHLTKSPHAAIAVLSEMAERLRETNALLSQRAAKDAVKEFEENLSLGQRIADRVAELNGSWKFIGALLSICVGWAILNTISPHPFDAYPYVFFNLVLAVLVSLQGPLIVMSQNRESSKDRAQAQADFRVNLKNEVNIESIRAELEAFRKETNARMDRLDQRSITPAAKSDS